MYKLLFFTFFSCMQTESSKETPEEDTASTEIIEADPVSPHGVLKIEQVYYAGSVPTAGIDRYYGDQFIQLTNTGTAPVQLGGVLIGDMSVELNSRFKSVLAENVEDGQRVHLLTHDRL